MRTGSELHVPCLLLLNFQHMSLWPHSSSSWPGTSPLRRSVTPSVSITSTQQIPDPSRAWHGSRPRPNSPVTMRSLRDLVQQTCLRCLSGFDAALSPERRKMGTTKINKDTETWAGAYSQGTNYSVRSFPMAAIKNDH